MVGYKMNKRLKDIALQCGAWNQVYGRRDFMINENFDIEKFAQLIIEDALDEYSSEIKNIKERISILEDK
jgi:hypothetical protein